MRARFLFLGLPLLSFSHSPSFEFAGKFSNMTYSQEHQNGQDVYLWHDGNQLYGYMEYSLGGARGDYTTTVLENLKHDKATGSLSFQARNPLYDEQGNVIRNLFIFDGVWRGNGITGTLRCRHSVTVESCWNDEEAVWRKLTLTHPEAYQLKSRTEWDAHVKAQLAESGARW